ncbi:MAG: CPBP family intramembrane metalloprotease [Bacteroidales bacterium]|nr:CPBP family intramembrane metalloprotease [Bacteroidales bacterium]
MKKIVQFCLIVFALSWLAAGIFYASEVDFKSSAGFCFAAGYMFFPLISVIIMQMIYKEPILKNVGISFKINRWWFVAWLGMTVFNLLALGVSTFIPGISFTTESPEVQQSIAQMSEQIPDANAMTVLFLSIFSGLMAAITINAVFSFGEEIAWRGWLLEQFKGKSFLYTAVITGVIWGVWHFPLILMGHNYPMHPVLGAFAMIVYCVALTIVMMFIRIKAKSVIAAAIAHGSLNATAAISVMYLSGFNDLLAGSAGLAGFAILVVVDCIIVYKFRDDGEAAIL